jgi:hypothetical protein
MKINKVEGNLSESEAEACVDAGLNGPTEVFLCIGSDGGLGPEKLRGDQFARTGALQGMNHSREKWI